MHIDKSKGGDHGEGMKSGQLIMTLTKMIAQSILYPLLGKNICMNDVDDAVRRTTKDIVANLSLESIMLILKREDASKYDMGENSDVERKYWGRAWDETLHADRAGLEIFAWTVLREYTRQQIQELRGGKIPENWEDVVF